MNLSECAALLRERDNVLILTHKRPDGDTLGSAAALCHALRRLGKTAYLYPNPQITLTYLPFVSDFLAPEGFTPAFTVSADVAEAGMLSEGFTGSVQLSVDHHPEKGNGFAASSLVRTDRAACGQIIYELIRELCGSVDAVEADLLYIAVSTDTGCFSYANTDAAVFQTAALLAEAGADVPRLSKLLFHTKSRGRVHLEGMICASLRHYQDNQLNIAVITLDMLRESGAREEDCEDLAGIAGQVAESRVSVTVRELGVNRSKISLRTDGSVNATEVCARFGGGGHRMASGCELMMGPDEAAETMLRAVLEVWP